MPQPATTSELLLQRAVDLLTEVRDLLQSGQTPPSTPQPPPAPPADATIPLGTAGGARRRTRKPPSS